MTDTIDVKKYTKAKRNGVNELSEFLQTLETPLKPTLHINGTQYPNCVLTVDFGQPLNPPELSPLEEEKLKEHLKLATRGIFGRQDMPVRLSHDAEGGVWWASTSY